MPPIKRHITARGGILLLLSMGLFLMGAHFSNNLIFLISFLMIALIVAAAITQWRGLKDVSVRLVPPEMASVGTSLRLVFQIDGLKSRRLDAAVVSGQVKASPIDEEANSLIAEIDTSQRMVMHLEKPRLLSTDQFGLFRAERLLSSDECPIPLELTIYPSPDWAQPASPGQSTTPAGLCFARGEIAGLRPYRVGDNPADISWRATARHKELIVREFDVRDRDNAHLYDWADVASKGVEPALSSLSAAVLSSIRDGVPTGLNLPGEKISVGEGPAQSKRLLRALAAFPAD
ncbi:MAG: DUF58 domain-containing protein [Pseudomonadota bacterium]